MYLLNTKSNLASYPKSAFKGSKSTSKLIEKAVKHQDYAGLKHALNNFDDQSIIGSLVEQAIKFIDVTAISIADLHIKAHPSVYQVTDQRLRDIFDNDNEMSFGSTNKDELNLKRISIFKMVISWLKPEQITISNLKLITQKLPKADFEYFCANKSLDLNKFPDLDLSSYKYNNANSIVPLDPDKVPSVIDILLSRTYADTLVASKVYAMYQELYNLDPIAKEMLTYMAVLIKAGNDVKVIIEPNAASSYNENTNIIKVDPDFKDVNEFTTSSVLIHEIGHFFYHQLFQADSMPFLVRDIVAKFNELKEDDFIDDDFQMDIQFFKHEPSLVSLISMLGKYENAAKQPLHKAAELLQVIGALPEKYSFTSEHAEYFKQSTIIDLFLLNSLVGYGFKNEGVSSKETPWHVYKTILDIYMQYSGPGHNSCPSIDKSRLKDLTQSDVETWALEQFLPHIVTTLNLDAKDIHFLQRIADYVNRGEHMYDDNCNRNNSEKYAELIVRYLELKAADAKADVVESFEGLAQYHRDFVSPIAQQVIGQYQDTCNNVTGEHNVCLDIA